VDEQRIDRAADAALEEFWASIAASFPEATSGDFPPDAMSMLFQCCRSAVVLWTQLNVTKGGKVDVE
jgi:hypothetical protein